MNAHAQLQTASLEVRRKNLREKLMVNAVLDETPLVFSTEFHGGGDSGDVEDVTPDNKELNAFFQDLVENHVDFDWYNNEGGGGDITWDVRSDKITINGYYYEQVSTEAMVEVEI